MQQPGHYRQFGSQPRNPYYLAVVLCANPPVPTHTTMQPHLRTETIKSIAESVGISSLDTQCAELLTCDMELSICELIEDAHKFQSHSYLGNDALRINSKLTELSLGGNHIGDRGSADQLYSDRAEPTLSRTLPRPSVLVGIHSLITDCLIDPRYVFVVRNSADCCGEESTTFATFLLLYRFGAG